MALLVVFNMQKQKLRRTRINHPIPVTAAFLDKLEWSGITLGPGSGPMDSGDDGTPYASCPVCGQLKKPNNEFIESAVGHKLNCKMKVFLTWARSFL